MKIEIDFDSKTIEIKDNVSIGELVEKLKSMNLPEWESYMLKQNYISYPVYPNYPIYPAYPVYPLNPTWGFTVQLQA